MPIEAHYDEIARCNRCGFCQTACPVFRSTGREAGVARGRIALLRAIIEKRIDWSADLEDPLFACLLCGACTAHCFPALPTADLITDARSDYLDRVGRKPLHRLLFDHLLPYPKRLRLAARAAALGKRTGMSNIAKALGLLRFLGRDFPKAEEIVAQFPAQAFRDKVAPGEFPGRGESLRIGYFVGCGVDIMAPVAAEATLRLLQTVGKTVTVLDNGCCGLPALTYGDRKAARRLAAQNLDLLASHSFDLVVTDCSSCASYLKKYPQLFDEGDRRREQAVAFAAKVRDFVEVAAKAERPRTTSSARVVATYHDPCHASRGQKITKDPRDVLRSLPGVEYRELPEADWCCGGAGSYAMGHYDLARQILERKMANVARTGANLLVTSCPACILQLSYGVRLAKLPVRVCHISELCSPAEAGAVCE
ncbi:MAG: (Fe-S)-binding protein [Phycisphaerae bacterium]|nr:(Fe-S)-binding protein [Phycisphaerae bacterium]